MSPAAPAPYCPEREDPPRPFDVERHQIDNFKDGGRRDALWEFLSMKEQELYLKSFAQWSSEQANFKRSFTGG